MAKDKVSGKARAATDFEKIINAGRERKQNEALANEIFSRNRRQSAPSAAKNTRPGAGPSLASRVGITKKRVASAAGRASLPATGNVDGEWTHDLHSTLNGTVPKGPKGSLAARISAPGQAAPLNPRTRAGKRAAQLSSAIERADETTASIRGPPRGPKSQQAQFQPRPQQQQQQQQAQKSQKNLKEPVSIKGLAGPFAVYGQNFATGTTAADIESAMTRVGGEMVSCVVLKTQPFILAEMVFVNREGGERVIEMFNDAPADGRILKVYPKPGGYTGPPATTAANQPFTARMAPTQIVDGTRGFAEGAGDPVAEATYTGNSNGRLYSDSMVAPIQRGRGFRGDWTKR